MARNKTYMLYLPDELKIKILSYLKTYDIIQFCEVYPSLRYILYDKDLISTVDFCKEFRLHLEDLNNFISARWNLRTINCLNINGVYWISSRYLHRCILKLPHLKNLYAIDTELGFSFSDCCIYKKCTKLKVLALSVKDDYFYHLSEWPRVKHIYLYITTPVHDTYYFIRCLKSRIKCLERIWTFREQVFFPRVFHLVNVQSILDQYLRSTVHLEGTETMRNAIVWSGAVWKQFLNRFNGMEKTIWSMENIPTLQFLPFGVKDVERLCKRKYNLQTINVDELNFYHSCGECIKRYNEFVHLVLTSSNVRYLRKLAISFCICQKQGNYAEDGYRQSAKRSRLSYEDNGIICTFQSVTENCNYLEELEIWNCREATLHCSAIKDIARFKCLKRLSLIDIPLHMSGRFLIKVFKDCQHLEHLNIKTTSVSRSLCNNLILALPFANSLKDLRCEQTYMPVQKLFGSLNCLRSSRLQRVFIKCDSADKFTAACIKDFLKKHKELVFLFIVVKDLAEEEVKSTQKIMDRHKNSAKKVFYITTNEDECVKNNFIPAVHKIEMVQLVTKVSVYNHFENCNI